MLKHPITAKFTKNFFKLTQKEPNVHLLKTYCYFIERLN